MSGPTNKRGNNEQVVDLEDEPSSVVPSKYEDNLEPAVPTLKPTGRSVVIDPKKSGLSGDEVEIFIYSGREDGERDAVFVQLDIEGATLSYQIPRDTWSRIPVEVFEATIDNATMELFEPDPRSDGGLSIRQTPRFNYKVRRTVKQAA